MAALCGFEFQECDWCSNESHHFCFQCIHTHWGDCCGKMDREEAVWSYLFLKGLITHVPKIKYGAVI